MKRKVLLSMIVVLTSVSGIFAQKQADNKGGTGQNWLQEISSNYFYIRVASNTNLYWDLPGKHPETAKKDIQFQIWGKDDDPYERTFIFPKISGTNNYAIQNKAGYIVDVGGKKELSATETIQEAGGKKFKMKKDNGAEIKTWLMENGGCAQWQQWKIIVVDKNVVMFENIFTGKAIDVKGGVFKNGTKLNSWKRNNSDSQKFVLEYADGPKKGQLLDFEL